MEYQFYFEKQGTNSLFSVQRVMKSLQHARQVAERLQRREGQTKVTAVYNSLTEKCIWRAN